MLTSVADITYEGNFILKDFCPQRHPQWRYEDLEKGKRWRLSSRPAHFNLTLEKVCVKLMKN